MVTKQTVQNHGGSTLSTRRFCFWRSRSFFFQLTQRSTCGYFLSHVLPQSGAGGQAGRGNDGEGYDTAGLSSQIQQIYES